MSARSVRRSSLIGAVLLVIAALAAPLAFSARTSTLDGRISQGDGAHPGNAAAAASALGVSADGQVVAFATTEALDSADTDGKLDLYMRVGSTTTLLTPGAAPLSTDPEFTPGSVTVLPGGQVLYLSSNTINDTVDSGADDWFLASRTGSITAISGGTAPNQPALAGAVVSGDGSTIAFTSKDRLAGDPALGDNEVYSWSVPSGGPLKLATPGTFTGTVEGITRDGSKLFYVSGQQQGIGTLDGGADDIFSVAPDGTGTATVSDFGSVSQDVVFSGNSPDGSTVTFATTIPLAGSGDADGKLDLYANHNGALEWLTAQPGDQANVTNPVQATDAVCDSGTVLFTTNDNLAAGDTGSTTDIYRRAGGAATTPVLLTGASGFAPTFVGASDDCSVAAFRTVDALSAGDTNGVNDIYLAGSGAAQRITPDGAGDIVGVRDAVSGTNLATVTYSADAKVTGDDTDSADDVYQWVAATGTTRLVSVSAKLGGGDGQRAAAVTPDGNTVIVTTPEQLEAADTDSIDDVYRYTLAGADPTPTPTPTVTVTPTSTASPTSTPTSTPTSSRPRRPRRLRARPRRRP